MARTFGRVHGQESENGLEEVDLSSGSVSDDAEWDDVALEFEEDPAQVKQDEDKSESLDLSRSTFSSSDPLPVNNDPAEVNGQQNGDEEWQYGQVDGGFIVPMMDQVGSQTVPNAGLELSRSALPLSADTARDSQLAMSAEEPVTPTSPYFEVASINGDGSGTELGSMLDTFSQTRSPAQAHDTDGAEAASDPADSGTTTPALEEEEEPRTPEFLPSAAPILTPQTSKAPSANTSPTPTRNCTPSVGEHIIRANDFESLSPLLVEQGAQEETVPPAEEGAAEIATDFTDQATAEVFAKEAARLSTLGDTLDDKTSPKASAIEAPSRYQATVEEEDKDTAHEAKPNGDKLPHAVASATTLTDPKTVPGILHLFLNSQGNRILGNSAQTGLITPTAATVADGTRADAQPTEQTMMGGARPSRKTAHYGLIPSEYRPRTKTERSKADGTNADTSAVVPAQPAILEAHSAQEERKKHQYGADTGSKANSAPYRPRNRTMGGRKWEHTQDDFAPRQHLDTAFGLDTATNAVDGYFIPAFEASLANFSKYIADSAPSTGRANELGRALDEARSLKDILNHWSGTRASLESAMGTATGPAPSAVPTLHREDAFHNQHSQVQQALTPEFYFIAPSEDGQNWVHSATRCDSNHLHARPIEPLHLAHGGFQAVPAQHTSLGEYSGLWDGPNVGPHGGAPPEYSSIGSLPQHMRDPEAEDTTGIWDDFLEGGFGNPETYTDFPLDAELRYQQAELAEMNSTDGRTHQQKTHRHSSKLSDNTRARKHREHSRHSRSVNETAFRRGANTTKSVHFEDDVAYPTEELELDRQFGGYSIPAEPMKEPRPSRKALTNAAMELSDQHTVGNDNMVSYYNGGKSAFEGPFETYLYRDEYGTPRQGLVQDI